jgi:hypothetical protein
MAMVRAEVLERKPRTNRKGAEQKVNPPSADIKLAVTTTPNDLLDTTAPAAAEVNESESGCGSQVVRNTDAPAGNFPAVKRRRSKSKASIRAAPAERYVFTIAEFCAAHNLSESFYYKLKADGEGPDEMVVGARRLVSCEAATRWRRACLKPHRLTELPRMTRSRRRRFPMPA